jgi:hypothetical protein
MTDQKGSPGPETLKVCINYRGGYRNSYSCMLTGLDIEEKAKFAVDSVWRAVGAPETFDSTDVRLIRSDHPDAATNSEATARLTITVKDKDPNRVGRAFSAAVNGIGLAIYPGNYNDVVSPTATEYGVLWSTLVPAELITQNVHIGEAAPIQLSCAPEPGEPTVLGIEPAEARHDWRDDATTQAPLGRVMGARSGDKGGNANIGVWARADEAYDWLHQFLTTAKLAELLPEAGELAIDRYELANIRGLNFLVRGILGEGVAASTRQDSQAKSLGEFLRSRYVDIPSALLS